MELFSNLTKDEEKRIVLVHAMRDSKEELKKLYVADAKEVFILGDNGELDDGNSHPRHSHNYQMHIFL